MQQKADFLWLAAIGRVDLHTWTRQYRSSGTSVFQPLCFAAEKPASALGQRQPNTTMKRIVQARAGGFPSIPHQTLLLSRLFRKSLFSALAYLERKFNLLCHHGTKTLDTPCPTYCPWPPDVLGPSWVCYLIRSALLERHGSVSVLLPVRDLCWTLHHAEQQRSIFASKSWGTEHRLEPKPAVGWMYTLRSCSTLVCSQQQDVGGWLLALELF